MKRMPSSGPGSNDLLNDERITEELFNRKDRNGAVQLHVVPVLLPVL